MGTSRFSENPWLNVLVVAVLPLAACALVFVSHQFLRPLSLAILVCAAAAALGLRAYARRLAGAAAAIETAAAPNQAGVLAALFGKPERRLLGVSGPLEVSSAVAILKRRRAIFLACGAFVRMVAVTSAIVALVLFFG
jgi:hypothetical protein